MSMNVEPTLEVIKAAIIAAISDFGKPDSSLQYIRDAIWKVVKDSDYRTWTSREGNVLRVEFTHCAQKQIDSELVIPDLVINL
ncbi:hypothetical protein H6783_00095 [Candidatus Nomurabacteria bacterium]|nr:hypothetical protein [Candidatus Nomurabacteria bacterium]